ncbi:MAG: Asp-tRNA(Asn)/Glu-tRNA(Gln) amidotransferase subunit GatA [Desulfobulbaceae bacterium]|uniref:Glutamyl-tRNA(Gln) amidotransferase subunit A n=1 Tax=Candidatus Desulfatifera sulfidica TaxID=2841691 RepID=A0A8J6NA92_9BACT|nr:Asp-tRNA(Asn)/Glu-tRNA(Gln) amidotransferase subunit GatA [Candidatus Desulfatifera sulfidica]
MNPYELTVGQAADLLAAKKLSSRELVQSCLDRIEQVEPQVKAFLNIQPDQALVQADAADVRLAEGGAGSLCGVPVSIKDLICTQGTATTCGSRMLENFVPPYDATVISSLKAEGAVLIGKVAMDEFAMGSTTENCAFQTPDNPWKSGYVCGGSSGGSAASVAALECPASLGSDTGGSIRQPASLCGVVGLKPTYGRVSRYGLVAFASSLDQIGPLTRDVHDCALMMNVISGYDRLDSTSVQRDVPDYTAALREGLAGMTIGLPREYFGSGLDPEVEQATMRGVDVLKAAGAKVVDVSLPHTDYCLAVYYLIAPAEASSNLARYDGVSYGLRDLEADSLLDMYKKTRSKGFADEVKRRILIGTYALSSGYYDAYYKKASQVRTLILEDFKQVFTQCDLLISPVVPTPAWKIGEKTDDPLALYLSDVLTTPANLAGIPGISVPGGLTASGLPVGIQLQGPHFAEDRLLYAAYNLEKGLALNTVWPKL